MKKKNLFLLLTVLWLFNFGIGTVFLYRDFATRSGGAEVPESMFLAHGLYMAAALVAAAMTFFQYRKLNKKE